MYSITDFDRHYITGDMKRRKVKRPSWFKCPTDSPEVLNLIHGHPNGLSHLGCWNRLQGWAVMNWHTDGGFATSEGEMTVGQIAIHIGLYGFDELLQEAITRLVAIGWMSSASCDHDTLTRHSRDSRDRITDLVANPSQEDCGEGRKSNAGDLRQHNITEQNIREENKEQGQEGDPRWLKTKGWINVTDERIAELTTAFPSVDVSAELLRMDAWLKANPTKSHKRQWLRFVTNWLSRSQESVGTKQAPPAVSASWGQEAAS